MTLSSGRFMNTANSYEIVPKKKPTAKDGTPQVGKDHASCLQFVRLSRKDVPEKSRRASLRVVQRFSWWTSHLFVFRPSWSSLDAWQRNEAPVGLMHFHERRIASLLPTVRRNREVHSATPIDIDSL